VRGRGKGSGTGCLCNKGGKVRLDVRLKGVLSLGGGEERGAHESGDRESYRGALSPNQSWKNKVTRALEHSGLEGQKKYVRN